MSSRTSAMRGLALVALSVLGFAACESKTNQVQIFPAATLSVTPAGPVALNIGQTAQLAASTTGFAGTPTITYTSSVPAAATVSATGLITAVATGTTTITIKATGTDLNGAAVTNLASAVQVNVNGGTVVTPPITSISIASLTNSAGQNVDRTNVSGQINVNMNVDIPIGVKADSVVVFDGANKLCVQTLTSGSSTDAGLSAEAAEAPVSITCSVNSAALGANGLPSLLNGSHTLTAGIYAANVRIASATDFAIILNNNNYIMAVVTTSRGSATGGRTPGPGNLAPAGSLWNAGDVVVTLTPVIYNGSANSLASSTVSLATSGFGVTGVVGCQPTYVKATDPTIAAAQGGAGAAGTNAGATPNCPTVTAVQTTSTLGTNGVMTVTFPEANVMNSTATGGNGVKWVEALMNIGINSVTSAGQPGPVCINPNPSTNPQNPTVIGGVLTTCGNGFTVVNAGTGQQLTGNQLRLDNLAPRITNFDITPATLGCAPNTSCYINNPSAISAGFTTVDYGVDSQTSTFAGGAAGTTALGTTFAGTDETATSGNDVAAVTTKDALANSSTRFASTTPGNTVATATTAGVQTFGVDITAPTCAYVNTPAASVVTANELDPNPATEQFALTFSDSATPPAGPSGFPTLPVVRTELGQTPAASTCIIGTGTAPACVGVRSAGTAAPVAGAQFADQFNAGAVTERYVTYNGTVNDVAGNTCSVGSRVALYDVTAPAVGGVVSPSTIAGNQAVTFSATASDNLDLGAATPSEAYGAVIAKLLFPTVTLGTFGPDVFTTTATVNFTDPAFVRSVETTAPAGRPTGAVQQATGVSLAVADIARPTVFSTTNQDITTNVAAGSPTGFPSFLAAGKAFDPATNPAGGFTFASSNATVCNNATVTTTCTNPTSTVLTASATGPASVFNNPFTRVNFYYTDGAGNTRLIGQGTVSVTDNTITSTRTWSYTITWTPSTLAAGVYSAFAIGVDASGSGLMTTPGAAVTITNP